MVGYSQDKIVLTAKGYLVRIIIEVHYLPNLQLAEFPDNYKFKWMAFCLGKRPYEYIRFDNHRGKPPHYHIDEKEIFFKWTSLEETEKMFFKMVRERFGYFELD
jgi:hypothetical protein